MNKAAVQKIHIEKILVVTLVSVCVSLFALYIYFVSASVLHVVMRTEVHQQIASISSEISELEGKYIQAQHKVSSDVASLQGYTHTSKKIFIDKTPSSLVLFTGESR